MNKELNKTRNWNTDQWACGNQ